MAKILGQAAALAPKNARIHYNFGLALQKLGRPAEAEREFRSALDLAPRTPDFLNALATLYIQQQRWPQAIDCAEQLVRLAPENIDFQRLLAQIRAMQKRWTVNRGRRAVGWHARAQRWAWLLSLARGKSGITHETESLRGESRYLIPQNLRNILPTW